METRYIIFRYNILVLQLVIYICDTFSILVLDYPNYQKNLQASHHIRGEVQATDYYDDDFDDQRRFLFPCTKKGTSMTHSSIYNSLTYALRRSGIIREVRITK